MDDRKIRLRLNDEDFNVLKASAAKAGKSVEELARMWLLSGIARKIERRPGS